MLNISIDQSLQKEFEKRIPASGTMYKKQYCKRKRRCCLYQWHMERK